MRAEVFLFRDSEFDANLTLPLALALPRRCAVSLRLTGAPFFNFEGLWPQSGSETLEK